MSTGSALETATADKLRRQLETWRKTLLALDRRQRLLYFRHTKSSSFELSTPGPVGIASILGTGARIGLLTDGGGGDSAELTLDSGAYSGPGGPNDIRVKDKREAELATGLRRLDQVAQTSFADRGLWTLHVGLGMMQWVDPDGGKTVESPMLMIPVELIREGKDTPYRLQRNQEEVVFNPALRLKLENDFAIKLPDFDIDDINLAGIFADVRAAIAGQPTWAVLERSVMTTFSFHKEAMFRDLGDNNEAISSHPLVQLLALGPESPTAERLSFDPISDDALDSTFPPEHLVSILDADGSQRRCILAAKDGNSFVMDGPPGTGKSQTIANIIVEMMADGKTVLFVSEKAAALDVVRNRLAGQGLSHFLLELHSHAATRKNIVEDLHTSLTKSVVMKRKFTDSDLAVLRRSRLELDSYANAMNEIRVPLGRSLFQVIGRMATLTPAVVIELPRKSSWSHTSDTELSEILDRGQRLRRAWRPAVLGDDFLWAQLSASDHDESDAQQMAKAAGDAATAGVALVERLRAVDEDLGLSFAFSDDEVHRRMLFLRLAEVHPGSPDHWVTSQKLARTTQLAELRRTQGLAVLAARDQLEVAVGANWRDLDKAALDAVQLVRPGVWYPAPDIRATQGQVLGAFLSTASARLKAMEADALRLGSLLGMPQSDVGVSQAATYVQLARLGGASARPEAGWLNPAAQNAVEESIRVLQPLVHMVNERERAMNEVFTRDALALDLSALNIRFRETYRGFGKFSSNARADKKALRAVTKAGKVDKGILARLEEAAAWQSAHATLQQTEQQFANTLGRGYRGQQTDFGRIGQALQVAQDALRLAGANLNSGQLATQLAAGALPDPGLLPIANRLAEALQRWEEDTDRILDTAARTQLRQRSLLDVARWCEAQAAVLGPLLGALHQLATFAQLDLTLTEARKFAVDVWTESQLSGELAAAAAGDEAEFGHLYTGLTTDWPRMTAALDWARSLRDANGGPLAPSVAANMRSVTMTSYLLHERVKQWETALEIVLGYFRASRISELRGDFRRDIDLATVDLRAMAESGAGDIDEYCRFLRESAWLGERGLGDLVAAMVDQRIDANQILPSVEYAVLQAWANEVTRDDERVRQYRSQERNDLVERFQDLDTQLVQGSRAIVVERCAQRRPRSASSMAAQVIIREAQKKTRHKPIRTLLLETAELVQELKPCFMMSPLSVSQFLPATLKFDVVIFDEASQVLPADAINCVYRGDQLIVAGDQKQLPPTQFFTAVDDDEDGDNEDLDKFDSVLDLAKGAGGLTSLPLSWHYRSKHEDLITYSNYRFYKGELSTFPSAAIEAADLGVELFPVDGVYTRGGGRNNQIEAERVADRVQHHLYQHPNLTLGVVTFSGAQEDAILLALDARARSDSRLHDLLSNHERLDGFFVKSLENVQGDERDIIIFSIGYGPDEFGKLSMNFGPLNRDGGWRRLNVAITRARYRVEVVCSFRAAQMTETNSEGVRHLRGYLDFADRGIAALAAGDEDSEGDAESPFEEQVAQVIRSWGYQVTLQVGQAGYRIDMAVKHPDRPGQYVLAVECDGAQYHSAKAVRDRDRLREGVLVGLGWRVHRIWGLSWWRERIAQESRLRTAIEEAVALSDGGSPVGARYAKRTHVEEVEFEDVDFGATPDWAVPYRVMSVGVLEYREPKSPEVLPVLRRYFEQILEVEAPIHSSLLMRRFASDWGIGRVSHLVRENAELALKKAHVGGSGVILDSADFYVVPGREIKVRVPSDSESIRKINQVPDQEIELAIANVVRDAVIASREQTIEAVSRLFGWRRKSSEIQIRIESALSKLIAVGDIEQTAGSGLRSVLDRRAQ